jgi:murein DD-endopeptidase MepM/ murein hydrolase activator NlpD
MAHFDFSLNDFTNNKNISNAIIDGSKNYTPTGQAKAIKTTYSMSDAKPQQALTTTSVSDILQGNLLFKPTALNYTQFNEAISDVSKSANTTKIQDKIGALGYRKYIVGFDTVGAANDLVLSGISSVGTQAPATTSTGGPAPASSGFILTGAYRFPTHKTHYSNPSSGTKAMDIGHAMGAPVFSPWDGRVAYIGYADGFTPKPNATRDASGGNAIVIVGDNGWSMYMCHFENQPIVNVNDRVLRGQNVAHVGSTGRSTGPHVHVSVAQSTNYADVWNNPIDYLWDFMKDLENQAGQTTLQVGG